MYYNIFFIISSLSFVPVKQCDYVDESTNDMNFDLNFTLMSFDFAAAAYSPNPHQCLIKHNALMAYRITVPCDYLNDECWSFIAIRDGWIIVSFRGTRTKVQLITELIETMSEPKKKIRAGGSVQHYFYVALKSIWKNLHTVIRNLRSIYPHYRILFTGHSLGGALASLASVVFAHRHPSLQNRIMLITFGQPRVGNYEYAKAHSRLVTSSWRVVHKYDLGRCRLRFQVLQMTQSTHSIYPINSSYDLFILLLYVAHLPACAFRLFSYSCTPLLNHSPYHHGTEVWYPSAMLNDSLFRICKGKPEFEDNRCSNGYFLHYGIKDHIRYFEHDVSSYGINGCNDV